MLLAAATLDGVMLGDLLAASQYGFRALPHWLAADMLLQLIDIACGGRWHPKAIIPAKPDWAQ